MIIITITNPLRPPRLLVNTKIVRYAGKSEADPLTTWNSDAEAIRTTASRRPPTFPVAFRCD